MGFSEKGCFTRDNVAFIVENPLKRANIILLQNLVLFYGN